MFGCTLNCKGFESFGRMCGYLFGCASVAFFFFLLLIYFHHGINDPLVFKEEGVSKKAKILF